MASTDRILRGESALLLASVLIGLAAIVFAFGFCVWPTPYRYDKINRFQIQFLYRTNRFTGHSERVVDPWKRYINGPSDLATAN